MNDVLGSSQLKNRKGLLAGCENVKVIDCVVELSAPMATEVIDVRLKSLVPGPSMISTANASPAFQVGEPVFKLAVTVEAGQGGLGPVKTAEIESPELTLARNSGVQTVVTAWAGLETKAEARPSNAGVARMDKREERIVQSK